MILKVVIEGILLGTLLLLFCAFGIRNGAVNMVFLYHKDVQDKSVRDGLITRKKIRRNAMLFKGLAIPVYFAFVLVSVYAVNGAREGTVRLCAAVRRQRGDRAGKRKNECESDGDSFSHFHRITFFHVKVRFATNRFMRVRRSCG